MQVVFNKTLGRIVSRMTSVEGSRGSTRINVWLDSGHALSTSVFSNSEVLINIAGDPCFNKQMLKRAAVGTVLTATEESNWKAAEPSNWFSKWEKIPSGAWIRFESSEDETSE